MIFSIFFICLPAFRRCWRTTFTPDERKRENIFQRAQDIRHRLIFKVQPASFELADTAYNLWPGRGATVIFVLLSA